MHKKIFATVVFMGFFLIHAQYSRLKINLQHHDLKTLSDLGLTIDHGTYKQNTFFIGEFSPSEVNTLQANAIPFEILIPDMTAYYQAHAKDPYIDHKNASCSASSSSFDPAVPANFSLGSYAGFMTYQEMLDELDEMRQLYPNLISVKQAIDTFHTIENRPIYWVRISDNPDMDEANEKEVMYSAIHHAREPNSMSELIFYMWYVLENYASSAEIQHIVQNSEMYFIPCLNPDGYIYNEITTPNGGGMHRKNRRNVGTSNKGVDLNRNYSYGWGTTGVSSNVNNDTYPGTGAFSEPETQAMKWFCENHEFEYALNAHTYGDLHLFPIGTTHNEFAVDHDYFVAFTNHMVKYNGYANEKSSNLYPASGDSDDYMYKVDLNLKPRIFAMTPEVGTNSEGFWPPQSSIIPNCKNMVHPNLILAHLPHVFGVTEDLDASNLENTVGQFNHSFERLGLTDGNVEIEITPLLNIQSVGANVNHNLQIMDIVQASINYTLVPTIQPGDEVIYLLKTIFPTWTKEDTIKKVYRPMTIRFTDDAANTTNWSNGWTNTTNTFYSPSSSFSDSEGGNGNYANNTSKPFVLNQTIDLTGATYGEVRFYAKWEIEANYDYCQFQVSTDGGNTWIGQCGKFTVPGVSANGSVQPLNQPIYEGFQTDWVLEEISMSDYLGQTIQMRFLLESDGGVNEDGFYFDDFTVLHDGTGTIGLTESIKSDLMIYPNPAQNSFTISSEILVENPTVKIFDIQGKMVLQTGLEGKAKVYQLNNLDLENGVYTIEIWVNETRSSQQRLVIAK